MGREMECELLCDKLTQIIGEALNRAAMNVSCHDKDLWGLRRALVGLDEDLSPIHREIKNKIRELQRQGVLDALNALAGDERYNGACFSVNGREYSFCQGTLCAKPNFESVPF
jgi:hypothetical protein